jgi:hypothetical protein
MENFFNAQSMSNLPWSPIALWQANLQMMSNLQQTWLHMLMPGARAMDGRWASPESFLSALMPFMPKIEATITPLKKEGKLADVDDASRVTMRLTVPGFGGQEGPEILLVDAVVARTAGSGHALPLDGADLPAALPKR